MIYSVKTIRLIALISFLLAGLFIAGNAFAEEPAKKNPLRIWEGQNKSYIQGTFSAQLAYFPQSSSWFGESQANLGSNSKDWWEAVVKPGVEGSYFSDEFGEAYGRFNAVQANTQKTDAGGSNNGRGDNSKIRVEDAVAGWRSGNLFSSLGKDFLDLSFGRQSYTAGNGFLFLNESGNGNRRGGFWIGERHAAQYMGLAHLKTGELSADFLYFRADDTPNTNTKVGGATLDYSFTRKKDKKDDKFAGIGGGAYYVKSKINDRDKMSVYNIRGEINPFDAFGVVPVLSPFKLEGEYVYEDADSGFDNGNGWYVSGSYTFEKVPWKPGLLYRYSRFDENYDPLFYGFNDWGYWYQGEILGEYVLENSNLKSHTVRLTVNPTDTITAHLFYYNFKLVDANDYGVSSKDYADEVDLTIDWNPNDHLSFSLVAAWATPDDAAKESTGGNDDWWYGMLWSKITF